MKIWLWIVGLLVGTLLWAMLMGTAMGFASTSGLENFGLYIGMGAPVFGGTGIISGIVYLVVKDANKALWTWTILLLLGFTILGIGGAKIASVE